MENKNKLKYAIGKIITKIEDWQDSDYQEGYLITFDDGSQLILVSSRSSDADILDIDWLPKRN